MKDFMLHDFNVEKVVFATYVAPNTGNHLHKNRASHGLALYISGEKNYVFEGSQTIHVKKNSIIYMPKHSNYVVDSFEEGGCYAINFDISEPIFSDPFAFDVKNMHTFLDSFKQANALWKTKPPGYHMKCKAELYNILFNMQREYELGYTPTTQSAILHPAVEYIHSHYTEGNLSIGKLSILCGISEPYFRKLFFKNYGVSPLKYIAQLKLSRSKELIESGLYPVHEVAALSGFQNECYFSREFKKHFGSAPSKLKK